MPSQTTIKWEIRFSDTARKALKKLDKKTNEKIISYMFHRVGKEEDPRRLGKALTGNLKTYWRYRVEDYRIICTIKDSEFEILAVRIDHRNTVYKNLHFIKTPA